MAVFLTGNPDYVPAALLHNLKHNKVLHEARAVRHRAERGRARGRPGEPDGGRRSSAPGIHRVILRYGFMESPEHSAGAWRVCGTRGVAFDPMQASYFLGREVIVPAMVPKMPFWRLWLFLVLARNAVPATEFFRIPSDRVVELGVRVAI